ncbi:MAG: serine hydrolase [Rhodospirillaceae bacterium]
MRLILAAVAALLLANTQVQAQTAPAHKSGLTKLLEAELGRFAGPGGPYKGGIYIKHMTTGEEASVNARDHFETASTFKLAVMVKAYQMADRKELDLNKRYTIKPSDMRGGSGIFRFHDMGMNPTLRDVITQMVITSDNSATDIMIAQVGGKEKLNAWIKEQGYKDFHVNSTIYEFFRQRYEVADPKNASLTPEELFSLMSDVPAFVGPRKDMIARINAQVSEKRVSDEMLKRRTDEKYWLASVSPADMGRMLEGIEKGTIASKEACAEMIRIMRAQQAGTRKIPHWLSVPVAHKTGEVGGVTNDVGMIYAKSGPIIISFYSMGYTGLAADADDRLGAVARLIVEYFDGPS